MDGADVVGSDHRLPTPGAELVFLQLEMHIGWLAVTVMQPVQFDHRMERHYSIGDDPASR